MICDCKDTPLHTIQHYKQASGNITFFPVVRLLPFLFGFNMGSFFFFLKGSFPLLLLLFSKLVFLQLKPLVYWFYYESTIKIQNHNNFTILWIRYLICFFLSESVVLFNSSFSCFSSCNLYSEIKL